MCFAAGFQMPHPDAHMCADEQKAHESLKRYLKARRGRAKASDADTNITTCTKQAKHSGSQKLILKHASICKLHGHESSLTVRNLDRNAVYSLADLARCIVIYACAV